ncbi:MAG TPA: MBL fold metallo-hydrolase [Spirochaetia bacterium]|nr:MBL fold metallo-hydrolase [Spirochaetales bacterium]HRW25531.1 MBL fold metallo-hydrolase [Spirochaetia bacterium]
MIRITTLIENSPGEHLALKHEHGLSFCIEAYDRKVLFDTGQSANFIDNAAQLRIGLDDLDYVVLSHGHYDHSGGLRALAEIAAGFELVVGEGFFVDKYAERDGGYEFLGNNFTREFLDGRGIRYSQLSQPVRELVPGVYALGGFPRIHRDEVVNPRFKLLRDGCFVSDHFDDEIMLVVDSPKGLIALLGCSHPGMRNMLDAVKERFDKPILAVLGGTHLVEASDIGIKAAADYLQSSEIGTIGVSHCTGAGPMKALSESQKGYYHNRTGSCVVVM